MSTFNSLKEHSWKNTGLLLIIKSSFPVWVLSNWWLSSFKLLLFECSPCSFLLLQYFRNASNTRKHRSRTYTCKYSLSKNSLHSSRSKRSFSKSDLEMKEEARDTPVSTTINEAHSVKWQEVVVMERINGTTIKN